MGHMDRMYLAVYFRSVFVSLRVRSSLRFLFIFLGSAGRAEPFKSAAPLAENRAAGTRVRLLPVPVRLQKPPTATALPADPAPKSQKLCF